MLKRIAAYTSIRVLIGAILASLGTDLAFYAADSTFNWRAAVIRYASMAALGIGRIVAGKRQEPTP